MHSFMDIVRGSCNGGTTMCGIIAHSRKFDSLDNSANQSLFFFSRRLCTTQGAIVLVLVARNVISNGMLNNQNMRLHVLRIM